MTTTLSVTEQGVFHCEDCKKPLRGYDAFFTYCNGCQAHHLSEVPHHAGWCKLYPGCGCTDSSQCTDPDNGSFPLA